jgi:hypothetical protein
MSEAFGALAGASGKLPRGNDLLANVRFGSKADIGLPAVDVRFTPKSGHR